METIRREELLIEASELKEHFNKPNLRIFDATLLMNPSEGEPDARAVYETGHIPGAAFFRHQDFSDPSSKYQLTVPNAEGLSQALSAAGIDNESEIVFYSTGMIIWATRAWWLLRYAGHQSVRVLNGGLAAWQQAGGEVVSGVSEYVAARFNASLQPDYFVDQQEMQAALNQPDVRTVHSLPQPTFEQSHIPGAVCQPFTDFLTDAGASILPDEELKKRLVENHATGRTIAYCGGGVAATLNAVVCRLVGHPNVVVYDGSMSEWVGEGLPTEGAAQ
jgi:thiosulfate/3-mercaptopyruvate sulfurtransferase